MFERRADGQLDVTDTEIGLLNEIPASFAHRHFAGFDLRPDVRDGQLVDLFQIVADVVLRHAAGRTVVSE